MFAADGEQKNRCSLKINGAMDAAVRFIVEKQLKDRELWRSCIRVYETREDSSDEMWRGEFFGKLMRGATVAYRYTQDEALYEVLTQAVCDMLTKQDPDGRFSTYAREHEFCGWDMWCRKYVLTGLVHYYEICKDEALKERILSACKKHLDYIVEHIGNGEGQKPITATSCWWGCVNSCSILEPVLAMYRLSGEARYLAFAEYIISTGGSSECNFAELALEGEKYPYEYPVVKAYETMSYFEGLLAYYELTGSKKYFEAVEKFVRAVDESDLTLIGCCGCTHELFDHSKVRQTEKSDGIMQETCVTVTWMRLLARLYDLTGEPFYIDRIEKSGFNALYGSLNTQGREQLNLFSKKYCAAKVFDSYSPLYMSARGRGIGGYLEFAEGEYCGCCVAIGACGIALLPLLSTVRREDALYINYLFRGTVDTFDELGKRVTLVLDSNYPSDGRGKITVKCDGECLLPIKIRKPDWCEEMRINGREANDAYELIGDRFSDGDEIQAELKMQLKSEELNGKVAFTYGPLTLAQDEQKSTRRLEEGVALGGALDYRVSHPEQGEFVRVECSLGNGDKLLLTDYQSCGKNWNGAHPRITVWMDKA